MATSSGTFAPALEKRKRDRSHEEERGWERDKNREKWTGQISVPVFWSRQRGGILKQMSVPEAGCLWWQPPGRLQPQNDSIPSRSSLFLLSDPPLFEREYENWDRPHIVIDTASKTVKETVAELLARLGFAESP